MYKFKWNPISDIEKLEIGQTYILKYIDDNPIPNIIPKHGISLATWDGEFWILNYNGNRAENPIAWTLRNK